MAEREQTESAELPDWITPELLIAAEGRRQSYDQMMWQVPGLSLAAQSFLLTIALAHDSTPAARITSGLIAFVAALATIQLLLKQRYRELEWSVWLERTVKGTALMRIWGYEGSEAYAWRGQKHPWKRAGDEQGPEAGAEPEVREAEASEPEVPESSAMKARARRRLVAVTRRLTCARRWLRGCANAGARRARHRLILRSSVNVWTLTLVIFALADLGAAGYGVWSAL